RRPQRRRPCHRPENRQRPLDTRSRVGARSEGTRHDLWRTGAPRRPTVRGHLQPGRPVRPPADRAGLYWRLGPSLANAPRTQRTHLLLCVLCAFARNFLKDPTMLHLMLASLALTPALADDKPTGIAVDKDKRTITVDAKMAPRKLPNLQEVYPIEVIACWGHTHKPAGKKAHETIVTIECKPSDIHKALQDLGLKPGTPVMGESKARPQGPEVNLFLEFEADGRAKRVPIERTLIDPKTKKPMPKVKWRFTGSVPSKPDPTKDETVYGADLTGTLISIFPVTNETVFQTNLTMEEEKYLKLETNKDLL